MIEIIYKDSDGKLQVYLDKTTVDAIDQISYDIRKLLNQGNELIDVLVGPEKKSVVDWYKSKMGVNPVKVNAITADIDGAIKGEEWAIKDYGRMADTYKNTNPELTKLVLHIQKEEEEHLRELAEFREGYKPRKSSHKFKSIEFKILGREISKIDDMHKIVHFMNGEIMPFDLLNSEEMKTVDAFRGYEEYLESQTPEENPIPWQRGISFGLRLVDGTLSAIGNTYLMRDILKKYNFQWQSSSKTWTKTDSLENLAKTINDLENYFVVETTGPKDWKLTARTDVAIPMPIRKKFVPKTTPQSKPAWPGSTPWKYKTSIPPSTASVPSPYPPRPPAITSKGVFKVGGSVIINTDRGNFKGRKVEIKAISSSGSIGITLPGENGVWWFSESELIPDIPAEELNWKKAVGGFSVGDRVKVTSLTSKQIAISSYRMPNVNIGMTGKIIKIVDDVKEILPIQVEFKDVGNTVRYWFRADMIEIDNSPLTRDEAEYVVERIKRYPRVPKQIIESYYFMTEQEAKDGYNALYDMLTDMGMDSEETVELPRKIHDMGENPIHARTRYSSPFTYTRPDWTPKSEVVKGVCTAACGVYCKGKFFCKVGCNHICNQKITELSHDINSVEDVVKKIRKAM